MYLQGNLQLMFDALYEMGVIEPVLKMDWQAALKEMNKNPYPLFKVMSVVNAHKDNSEELVLKLEEFEEETLTYLAMEVAREFADFHSRNEIH
jgi:hypothetical protein